MKHSTVSQATTVASILLLFMACGCNCGSGTTTAGNSVSIDGRYSMTVSANPQKLRTNAKSVITAHLLKIQADGVTWQPVLDAKITFRVVPYPNHACGDLEGNLNVQTDAAGDAKIKYKASNAPTTPGDTCYVWVVADRKFTQGTDSNVSDSITMKIY